MPLSHPPRTLAIVGLGCTLPDALDVPTFWNNLLTKRYSITETPTDRWSIADYYNPDPHTPDKTYSKIGGWVRGFSFDWRRWRMPPKVVDSMDQGQQWAVSIAADALADYGYPDRPLDTERTAVILGTAMGGELHYATHLRISFPEYANALAQVDEFSQLPAGVRETILANWHTRFTADYPPITEDSMPGELPNIVSGRVANMLNLRGPNFITDAACASSFAAINAAFEMLTEGHVDAVISGGVDRNMGVSSFVKFCKIGALSATGTRPFGDGADGFVMGEGAAAFLLKRLEDAERDGDKIYAVIRGVGGASDGKGKGITAPNPVGQQLAIQRAWENAGLDPATATLVEAHGTSTRVGDVVEVESLATIFGGAAKDSIALGSVKSNIGHLKAGAGAAGLLKTTLALHHKTIPPTLNARPANPNIHFSATPFRLAHECEEWRANNGTPRRAGVSAYGFGGTNFYLVLEEHIPGMLTSQSKSFAVTQPTNQQTNQQTNKPLRGILALSAPTPTDLKNTLDATLARVESGWTPPLELPSPDTLRAAERLIIDFGSHDELLDRLHKAQKAMGFEANLANPAAWKAMEAQGLFRGSGPKPGKIAFMFPGQGSQYANMGRKLADASPAVAEVFAEADRIMEPILGKPLTSYLFVDEKDPMAVMKAEIDLMQTEITQPAMLTLDMAIYKLLDQYGFKPDVVMGHSLGEYAALIAAGVMPFAHALEATAARGAEMAAVDVPDKGKMAAVIAPYEEVEAVLKSIDGYVVPANINSHAQSVIGGESAAVEKAFAAFQEKGFQAMMIPVSHAFHTRIVAPAGVPLRKVLDRLSITAPQLPIVANLTGEFYPTTPETIKDCLQQQVASPVQWVKSLHTLYNDGVRAFLEVGPKRALRGFANDVFKDKPGVVALLTNHPKGGEIETFNQALCGLYAAGYGITEPPTASPALADTPLTVPPRPAEPAPVSAAPVPVPPPTPDMQALLTLLTQALQPTNQPTTQPTPQPFDRNAPPLGSIIISGTGLGLPGAEKPLMDPDNALRILRGEQFVDLIPERFRKLMLAKRITRLVKDEQGNGRFETIDDAGDVIKLAGRPGAFDLAEEYGVPQKLVDTLDITTQLAMAAGLDALREAGIPLVMTYKRTTTGKFLPERWMLPEALRDETGVIFASAFPGGDRFAEEFKRYYTWQTRVELLETLEEVRRFTADPGAIVELNRRITTLRETMERDPYTFDRRFIFRILSMGHAQFAEYVGARGPNTQVNSACASTTQAIAIAEDWIRTGRARRVLVIAADDVTGEHLLEWVGAGFLALGAAATDDEVDKAALPFDRRRHGTLLGMGAAALVIESEDAARERGMRGIVELLSSETRNSAFHGSRLDVEHIHQVLNDLITSAERRFGLNRYAMAQNMVFMSHETYTPARGGSASAEVVALRNTFGQAASDIVVANTKGFTGHPMGVGIEDVIAIKILEHGLVPPVPNHREVDPDLGSLNLSRGGRYPVIYALHLAAGFGSQISFALYRRIPGALDRVDNKTQYQHWLDALSGYDFAQTEVVKRNLRVVDKGAPTRAFAASSWQYGTGPMVRVFSEQYSVSSGQLPVVSSQYSVRSSQPAPIPANAKIPIVPPPPTTLEPPKATVAPAPVVETPKPEPANQQVSESATQQVASQQVSEPTNQPTDQPTHQSTDTLTSRVLAIVSEQTGYPTDILDPALDLEADLGVDTVKQAETFAAIRAEFNIPRKDDLKLRDYPTLAHVIGFVKANTPHESRITESQQIASQPTNQPTNEPTNRPTTHSLESANLFPRRVPTPVLRPALGVCKPTGVKLDGNSRVIVATDNGGVGKALVNRLEKLGVTVLALDPTADTFDAQLQTCAESPVQGVYWLPALDVEPDLAELDLPAWRELNRVRVKNLYTTMRALYESVSTPGTFLVSATRLGGLHGYGDDGATAPLGGAVTGFTKAYKRERPDVLVKAVDFEPKAAGGGRSRKTAQPADALIAETLADPGIVEVGYRGDDRFTITLEESPLDLTNQPTNQLTPQSVFLVTGAAGSITSAIVTDLAAASGGVFYLLDLVPEPNPADPKIALFRKDKAELQRALIEEMKTAGERPIPAQIEKRVMAVERLEAALAAMEAVRAAGGTVHYHSVNLLDGAALTRVVDDIRARYGKIDVLVHAGGIEISRALPDKDQAQFDLVFDIKADGFFSLLKAAQGMPIGTTVAFSSVAGRFGNAGQTDYAAANDLLCKLTSSFRRTGTARGIVIDWTAWGGIGMATRGSIPTVMKAAGIDMLPPESGIPTVRRELLFGNGEIVVGGKLGVLMEEWDATGGVDLEKFNAWIAEKKLHMVGAVKAVRLYGGLEAETPLDPNTQPFLYDHAMDGTPLLPGVMGVETFAELATALAPGYAVAAVQHVDYHAPFKFYRMEPQTMYLRASAYPAPDGLTVRAAILSKRTLATGEVQEKVHFTGEVKLLPQIPTIATSSPNDLTPKTGQGSISADAIYKVYFHGPAYQVLEKATVEGEKARGWFPVELPPNTAPADVAEVMSPRLIELCFQTAGVWQIQTKGEMALPLGIEMVTRYAKPEPGTRLLAVVQSLGDAERLGGHDDAGASSTERFNAQVVDEAGTVYVDLKGYRTVVLPGSVRL
ncbi:MAG: SDR family NAD(P)-dependent oxidoreductase [Anaerolineales bacterium]|nr:SDR family NAD(P)-dependent oxidoreductase [Anaerolineales bacterium]